MIRSRTFEHTISPFHPAIRSGAGPAGVLAAVEAEADAWVPDFRHAECIARTPKETDHA